MSTRATAGPLQRQHSRARWSGSCRSTRAALLATFALAATTAAVAHAATPLRYANFCINCNDRGIGPGGFHVSRSGQRIDVFRFYNNCAPVPVAGFPSIAIRRGKFASTVTVRNVIGSIVTYEIKGSFRSSRLATGTITTSGPGKSCATVSFRARFRRRGAAGGF